MAAVPAPAEGWVTRMGTGGFGKRFVLSTEKLATVFILVQQSGQINLKEKEVSRKKHLAVHRTSCITKHTGRGPYPGIVGFLFYFKDRE